MAIEKLVGNSFFDGMIALNIGAPSNTESDLETGEARSRKNGGRGPGIEKGFSFSPNHELGGHGLDRFI